MSIIKKYKKSVENETTTNIVYSDIKDKIVMESSKEQNKRKKILNGLIIGGLALTAASVICVVSIAAFNNNKDKFNNFSDIEFTTHSLAPSITPLMNKEFSKHAEFNQIARLMSKKLIEPQKTDEEIIYELLMQFDTIIENDNNYIVKDVESDKSEYLYRQDISFKDLYGEDFTYSLYFNEGQEKTKNEHDEVEIYKYYNGIATQNNVELTFKCILEEEIESDEHEIKNTLYLYSSNDLASYTKVTSSSENEFNETETEYSYEIIKDGVNIASYSIEIEYDSLKNETELSIEFNEKEYSVTRVFINDEVYFVVEYENDEYDIEEEYCYKKVINNDSIEYILVR